MTNGKTTLKFSHNARDAIQAAIDALALAAAWTLEGHEHHDELKARIADLKDLRRRMRGKSGSFKMP